MTLHKPTFESVRHVAANMRAADREEIHPLWFDFQPEAMAAFIMQHERYAYLAAYEGRPVAVFGAIEFRPRAWSAFAFGTDEFRKVAPEMTRFLVRKMRPHLFREQGAVRVEAWSHKNHADAHRWLELLGAKGTPDPEYGPNGETYLHFVMRRSDFDVTEAKNAPKLVSPHGGTPALAQPAGH